MNKKQFARLVSFLLVVALLLSGLCGLFEYENSNMTERMKTYTQLEKDTVDALYIGSSGVHCFWIGAKAFEDYGITCYPLSSDAMPCWLVKNMIKQGLKYQTPKLIIVDLRCFVFNPEGAPDLAERRSRRLIDMLDSYSFNRIDAIRSSLKILNEVSEEDVNELSFYLPFIKFHDLWSSDEFSFTELGSKPSLTMGYKAYSKNLNKVTPLRESERSNRSSLDKYNTQYLNELIDYFEAENIDYLFVAEPRYLSSETAETYNGIFELLRSRKAPYVNYLDDKEFAKTGLDLSRDFYDTGHVNYHGAVKYTNTFAKYLVDNYSFPDRRKDDNCYQWNGVMEYIEAKVEKHSKK